MPQIRQFQLLLRAVCIVYITIWPDAIFSNFKHEDIWVIFSSWLDTHLLLHQNHVFGGKWEKIISWYLSSMICGLSSIILSGIYKWMSLNLKNKQIYYGTQKIYGAIFTCWRGVIYINGLGDQPSKIKSGRRCKALSS